MANKNSVAPEEESQEEYKKRIKYDERMAAFIVDETMEGPIFTEEEIERLGLRRFTADTPEENWGHSN